MRSMRPPALFVSLLVALIGVTPSLAAEEEPGRPSVVVTTEVLGSIVGQLAADVAEVQVLMGGGADPHSWQPSARDSEAIFGADLIVANGLDLEEGLIQVLDQAQEDGVRLFLATDHVTVRASAGAEEAPEANGGDDHASADDPGDTDDGHDHATGDPHFWLDPLAMRDVVLALAPAMAEVGVDVRERADGLARELEELTREMSAILAVVPAEQRQLVTGHGALGYFADRFGFGIVGTVVPGLSTADEPSAREIAALIEDIRASGASAVFTDVGTPQAVAEAVADEAGAAIIELQVAQLPEGGSYQDLLRSLAMAVASALAGDGGTG